MRGLGDLVAKGAKALGFEQKPGCGCAKRQEILNRWVPFGKGEPELRQPRVKSYDAITAKSVISSRGAKSGPFIWTTRKSVWPIAGGSGNEEPACADPSVIFCDNFEDRTLGSIYHSQNPSTNLWNTLNSKTLGWVTNDVFTGADQDQYVINSGCQDGGKCLAHNYPACPRNSDNGGGNFMGPNFPASYRTTYIRTWTKYPSTWVNSPIGAKYLYHGDGSGDGARQEEGIPSRNDLPNGIIYKEGGTITLNGASGAGNLLPNMNTSAAVITPGQWQCIETRVTYSTTSGDADHAGAGGTFDGYIQAWVGDTQVMEYANAMVGSDLGAGRQPRATAFLLSAYWNCSNSNCSTSDNAHPAWTRVTDRIIVSTARIGCGGSAPPPPQQPTITITGPTSNPTYLTRTSPL